jgi:hypothetical protein
MPTATLPTPEKPVADLTAAERLAFYRRACRAVLLAMTPAVVARSGVALPGCHPAMYSGAQRDWAKARAWRHLESLGF